MLLQFSKGECKPEMLKVKIYTKETDKVILWIRTQLGLLGYLNSELFLKQEVPPARLLPLVFEPWPFDGFIRIFESWANYYESPIDLFSDLGKFFTHLLYNNIPDIVNPPLRESAHFVALAKALQYNRFFRSFICNKFEIVESCWNGILDMVQFNMSISTLTLSDAKLSSKFFHQLS